MDLDDFNRSDNSAIHSYQTREFWAQDFNNGRFYTLTADLLAEGVYCNVWGERGNNTGNVNSIVARRVASTYDLEIYPKMNNVFGIDIDIYYEDNIVARNTMEFANWLVNGDGKLQILLLDIRDNYRTSGNNTYVAGYFWYGNFFDRSFSNRSAMIYIDTNPGNPGTVNSNATLAHEFQHLMNFVTSILLRVRDNTIYQMDTWIDEGLSSAAEWVIEAPSDMHWRWYNTDPSGLIQRGNNFFVWDNHGGNPLSIMDDYATVYLFFQWLRLQAGSTSIYRNIITSSDYDYRAVTSAANAAMRGLDYDNWGTLLKTWLAANYINAPSGPYGYMNDPILRNIQATTAPSGITSLSLFPGEGVYSLTNNFTLPRNTVDIHYAGLNRRSPALSDTTTFSNGALLTFNVNPNIQGGPVSGTTTGVAASVDMLSRQRALGDTLSGPFPISAGDMLRLNGQEEGSRLNLTVPRRVFTNND